MLNNLINVALEDEKVQQILVEKIKKVINDMSFTQDEINRIKTIIIEKTILEIKDKLEDKPDWDEGIELDEGDLFGN